MLPDAAQRLSDEQEIWITTVSPDGQPQSSPVGFLWDGDAFLILSAPDSPKVRNLRGNPRVALHLDIRRDGDGTDGGILTLEGHATIDTAPMSPAETDTYLARYDEAIRSAGMTPDEVLAEFSTVIRVQVTRARSY